MKSLVSLLIIFVLFSCSAFAQQDKDSIENAITRFFNGISEINPVKLKDYSTADFQLLEDGEVWNLDTLISKISTRRNSNIVRVNKFQFIKTEQAGNVAWVSYHNNA